MRARKAFEEKRQGIAPLLDDEGYPPDLGPLFSFYLENRAGYPYMRARSRLVDKLFFHYGTAGGLAELVQEVLDHVLDMLRLERSNHLHVRLRAPVLYIRLGREQDAYDFLKW